MIVRVGCPEIEELEAKSRAGAAASDLPEVAMFPNPLGTAEMGGASNIQ
jgi:hypothetical protein